MYNNRYYQKVGVTESHRVYNIICIPTIYKKLSVQYEDEEKHAIAMTKYGQVVAKFALLELSSC